MHKFAKQMADCLKTKVEGMGIDNIKGADLEEFRIWSEIIKNIVCYDKDYKVVEAMDKAKEEDEEDEKHFIKMLKEEYGMEDEDEARRFYRGQPRSRTSGRFMRRGDGRRSNSGRRGYEEMMPMDYRMDIEDYKMYPAEYWRDVDRASGRMYFSSGGSSGSSGNSGGTNGQSGGSGMSGGNSGGSSGGSFRGYSEGYSDGQTKGFDEGQRRGYEDGYRDGESRGRSQGGRRDGREGRSGQSRRSYMETKEMNKGNTPQEKQEKMKELEKYMGELSGDITEMISDASNEEKTMLKSKLQTLVQKIQ